jgi:hypothetical protein
MIAQTLGLGMEAMEKEKKPEFVVTDKRKFNMDGEARPDAVPEAPKQEAPKPEAVKPAPVAAAEPAAAKETAKPAAQSAAQSATQSATQPATHPAEPLPESGYNGERERSQFGGQKMEFIHLLDMLVQTAMMYAGALDTGAERRVDIVGVRQMIDLISVLEEKTKGNLTEQEKDILTNTVFQLRMTYMEIVNMIEKQAIKSAPGAPGTKIK